MSDTSEVNVAEVIDRAVQARIAADAVPEDSVEPEEGEEEEGVQFVSTGMIRVFVAGKRYRIRRPFLGELKRLRLAAEELEDELAPLQDQARQLAADVMARAKEMTKNPGEPSALEDLRRSSRKAQREIVNMAEELRDSWWRKVFEVLSLDGAPSDMPTWVTDQNIMPRVMRHWRMVPFRPVAGRGNGQRPEL